MRFFYALEAWPGLIEELWSCQSCQSQDKTFQIPLDFSISRWWRKGFLYGRNKVSVHYVQWTISLVVWQGLSSLPVDHPCLHLGILINSLQQLLCNQEKGNHSSEPRSITSVYSVNVQAEIFSHFYPSLSLSKLPHTFMLLPLYSFFLCDPISTFCLSCATRGSQVQRRRGGKLILSSTEMRS